LAALKGRPYDNRMQLDYLNALDADAAARELLRCCGSTKWARQMTAARPFPTVAAINEAADRIWWSLEEADWREAFAAHPKIGAGTAREAGPAEGADTSAWSAAEQSAVAAAGADVTARLAEANREYEARFGYIFIICATGKSAVEMLDGLERRLGNAPGRELPIAAEEQRKITRLRVAKLIDGDRAQAARDGRTDRP
jgi:2-oxo-4-hydroxy-4-carboxy-5-ureidoimidazoline decarboxylase